MRTHTQRTDTAARIIRAYAGDSLSDAQLVLSELLCDIMAWCRREGADFPDILRRAVQIRNSEHLFASLEMEKSPPKKEGNPLHQAGP